MDKKQKEALVLALYEKGETYRDIAKKAGVSPNTIKAIVNSAGLDESTSIHSRSFELFLEGKTLLQVAITLNLEAHQAIQYHQQYYMLLGCTEFTKLYIRIKDDPWPFVNLVKLVLDAGMNVVEVLELLKIANDSLPKVRLEYDGLEAKLSSLEANVQQSELTLQEINDRTSKESQTLEQYRSIYNQLKEEIENLNTKKARFENVIDSIQSNNEVYANIRQTIKQEIENIILNPRRLLQFAIASIFESSRKQAGRLQSMYYNMPTIRKIKRSPSERPVGDNQHEQSLYDYATDYAASEKMLLDEAEQLYNRLIQESMSACAINETTNKTESSIHSVQPPELDMHNGRTRKEDQYTSSDVNENDLLTVKAE